MRGRQRGEQRRLSRVREADQADVGYGAELDDEPLLLPSSPPSDPVGTRSREVASDAFPRPPRPPRAMTAARFIADQVGQQAVLILDPRTVGDPDHGSLPSPGLAALAATPPLRTQVRVIGEPRQVADPRGHLEDDVAAAAAVAAVGTAPGVVRLAQDRRRAVAAVAATGEHGQLVHEGHGQIVAEPEGPRHDGEGAEAVTVWAVELGKGVQPDEIKGRSSSAAGALFSPNDEARPPMRIALHDIAKVRRLRGSPVLMVERSTSSGARKTAFYFAQPPPLATLLGAPVEKPVGLAAFRQPQAQGAA